MSLTGTAKAYVPTALLWLVVAGGAGTRCVCLGGPSFSARSTLTYVSITWPREDSGTHARRREEDETACVDEDEAELGLLGAVGADFCCSKARKPGMLSFAEALGWT